MDQDTRKPKSNGSISKYKVAPPCKYLRCAAAVIAQTKSNDCVRVIRSQEQEVQDGASASASTPVANNNHPAGNRVQRRKEKKQRKKELRQQLKESTQQSDTIRVTTSTFPTSPEQLPQPIVHVKPLIVLDLNGILCHRIRREHPPIRASNAKSLTSFRPSIGNISNTQVIPRSDLDEFLTLLHNNFSLAVWTSATRKTAKSLVQALFPKEVRQRLVFVWNRSICDLVHKSELESNDCPVEEYASAKTNKKRKREGACDGTASEEDDSNNEAKPKSNKPVSHDDLIAIKCLSKVYTSFPLWDATNTILLDDSPEKCPIQHRRNALHPPPICGTITCSVEETRNKEGVATDTNSSGDHSSSLDDTERTSTDDDDINQTTQRNFFQLLAEHWAQPTPSENNLTTFLEEHASRHNMGWET